MDTPRIHIDHAYGQIEPNVSSDYAWIGAHRQELLNTYGTCVILVYQQQIIGKGNTLQSALEDAENHLSVEITNVTPVIEYLSPRPPFSRVQAHTSSTSKT